MITDYLLELDGKEVEVQVYGSCKARGGALEYEVERVTFKNQDRLGDVPEKHMEQMRKALWHEHLRQRLPLGDGEETAV